jgi:hypothetical protein
MDRTNRMRPFHNHPISECCGRDLNYDKPAALLHYG